MNFLRKTICFTKFPTFMNLFGHWAKNVQSFVLLCSPAGPSKKQPMCPEVVCDEKQKVSNVSKKGVFFIIVYGLWSEKFALSEKNISLGSKNSILCVQRNVLGENQNLCNKQLFFFCKILSAIEAKFFGLLGNLFPARLSSLRSTSAEEGFREKFLEKSFFFIVSRLGAKNRLLKEHQDESENFILRVRWSFFRKNILFKVIWLTFSCILSKEL